MIRAEEAKHKFKIFLTEFPIVLYTLRLARHGGNRLTVARHGQCLMSRREFDLATDSEADGEEEDVAHH